MHGARITTALLLAAGLACAGCNPDIGQPVETVIVQDAGQKPEGGDGGGTGAFAPGTSGASCAKNGDCTSNVCFIGNKSSYCSLTCTATNARTACAAPPFNGVCNMQGYCRLP